MAKLRHLGIRTEDTGKLASFYVDVFDMKVIHKSKEEGGTIFLSDGYFNLAIIPNKDQKRDQWAVPLRLRGRKRRGHRREDEKDQSQQIAKAAPPTAGPMRRPAGRIRMAIISTSRSMVFSMCNRWARKNRAKQQR